MYHWEKHLDQENIKVKILDNDRLNIYSLYNPLTINVSIFSNYNLVWARKKIFSEVNKICLIAKSKVVIL